MSQPDDEHPIEETLLPEEVGVVEVPLESPQVTEQTQVKPKAKPKARGMRGPDKKPRAKPTVRPPAITHTRQREAIVTQQESPESSADEATMAELRSLQLLRSIRAHDNHRATRKQNLYSSWFR